MSVPVVVSDTRLDLKFGDKVRYHIYEYGFLQECEDRDYCFVWDFDLKTRHVLAKSLLSRV